MRKLQGELGGALKIDVTSDRKEQVLATVRNIQDMQRPKQRIGFFEFMLRQIPFMGRELWMEQGGAALAMFGVLYLTMDGGLEYLGVRHIPLLLGILAIVLVMTSIPLILRSCQYQMQEIEMATRISLPKLLMAKLALLTIEYLAVFAFSMGMATGMAGLSAMRAAVYFVLPLLLAGTGCVQIITRTDGWDEIIQRTFACEGYCAGLAGLLLLLYNTEPVIYDHIRAWSTFTICMIPLFTMSIHRWVKESAKVSDRVGLV